MTKKADKIDTTRQQIQRMKAVVRHVQHMGPASREWVWQRLNAEECDVREVRRLRIAGYR